LAQLLGTHNAPQATSRDLWRRKEREVEREDKEETERGKRRWIGDVTEPCTGAHVVMLVLC